MARVKRLKIMGESAYYHIISRTVGGEYYLGEVEKEKLLSLIKKFSEVFFVKVIGFCIMDNHFHLLVKMEDGGRYSDEQIIERLKKVYKYDKVVYDSCIELFRKKLGDISEYVKEIKQSFSRWYNKVYDRKGYFWGDRFKSVIVESGEALKNMLIYIDLNPVRAGLVRKPEEYRWSSVGYRYNKMWDDGFLSFDGVYEENMRDKEKMYIEMLHKVIGIDVNDGLSMMVKNKIRYLVDGLAIGSKIFIKEIYERFGNDVIKKKDRRAHKINIFGNIYSVRCIRI